MENDIINKVANFLINSNVKHKVINDVIAIERDSIIEYISKICSLFNEEECYEEFLQLLIEEFGKRFFYQMKSDDNLYLDMIEE